EDVITSIRKWKDFLPPESACNERSPADKQGPSKGQHIPSAQPEDYSAARGFIQPHKVYTAARGLFNHHPHFTAMVWMEDICLTYTYVV
ncbi:Hypothetical predicted protein, partial [Pelobates cultripes]